MLKEFGTPEFSVSVSGISNIEQVRGISEIRQEEGFDFPISLGYQLSNKNINQGTHNPRQPRFEDLGDLHEETYASGLITAIHYYTKDNETILSDLERIKDVVRPGFSLLQFNTLPPTKDILRKAKEMGFEVIFKVAVSDKKSPQGGYAVWKGEEVQDVKGGRIDPLFFQVQEREEVIDYVMFDPSHGTNLDLELEENSLAIRFGKKITARRNMDHLNLVYAGGIKPSNVGTVVRSLNSFFPSRFSIDIESGVRRNDILDLDLVREYLANYQSAFERIANSPTI